MMPDYRMEALGWVKSSVGAVTAAELPISVRPNPDVATKEEILQNTANMEPESALISGIMLSQACEANCPELEPILVNFENVVVNATSAQMPQTPEVAQTQSN